MALFDRNHRQRSSLCSTATVVVLAALCLVGFWMMSTPENAVPAVVDTMPAAAATDVKKAAEVVKEEDSSIDATNNFKQDSAIVVSEGEETVKPAVDAKGGDGDGEKPASFDDENGSMEGGGEAVKAESDVKETAAGGSSKKQTFDDENGKMEGVEVVKDDGNKTFVSDDNAKPAVEEATMATADETKAPGRQAELLTERAAQNYGSFTTQAAKSAMEKKRRADKKRRRKKRRKKKAAGGVGGASAWKLCNSSAGADYIPCLDNEAAIKKLKSTAHYEHRERHCPADPPTCLVPSPAAYKEPIRWPYSRDKIWYHNVPHTQLADYKGHQNWVKVSGEHLTFPGGGTQFMHGALHYIDVIQDAFPEVAWGRWSRMVLDVGSGVASFGGFLFDRGALTMSMAPKDEHVAQVQFALERGIPAISAVMGSRRLPFPANVFDLVHCARCRVPWHIDGGMLLLEVNRLLRPGGFFVWSATPVYQKLPEDVEIWNEMVKLTKAMCWNMVKKTEDAIDKVSVVIFRKPESNHCYDMRSQKEPPLCNLSDDPNAAWNIGLRACMHRVPADLAARGSRWPEPWPDRKEKAPYWLHSGQVGVYGKPAPEDFQEDYAHWRKVLRRSYLGGLGIEWTSVRNAMDMRAVYGGLAAALHDMDVWVMNTVTIDSPDTLPVIYERGMLGIYHDWCESFSTYPRSYDLLHADHLFSQIKARCGVTPVVVEVDRILRPGGKLIVRDDKDTVDEVQALLTSLNWEVRIAVSKNKEAMLCAAKTMWRPTEVEDDDAAAAR